MSMSGRRRYINSEDFDEGDVWGHVMDDDDDDTHTNSINMMMMMKDHFSPSSSSRPRIIPKSSSTSMIEDYSKQASAPLDIPDWSKIYGMNVITPSSSSTSSAWVDGDGDGDGGMVPPHEFLARKVGRTQRSSFSVCEGIGRTLKGRDLRKVRNAILTRTGFIE